MEKEIEIGKIAVGANDTFGEAIEKIKSEWDNLTNSEKNEVVEFFEFGDFCKYDLDENGQRIIKEKKHNVRVDVLIKRIKANLTSEKEKDDFIFSATDFSEPDALRRTIIHLHNKYGKDVDGVYEVTIVHECEKGRCQFSNTCILVFDEGKIVYLTGVTANSVSILGC